MMLRRFSTIATAGFSVLAGCSDPAPLPVDAAMTIEITTCNVSSPVFNLPTESKTERPPYDRITAGDEGFRVTDGSRDVSASCRITGKEPFSITADVAYRRGMRFAVTGDIPSSGGTLNISEIHPDSEQLRGTCDIDLEFLNSGAIWAHFNCPEFNSDMLRCSARGTFIFENCK